MPKTVELNALLQAVVAQEVRAALAPHLALLTRFARLVDQPPARRAVEAPPPYEPPVAVRSVVRRPAQRASPADAEAAAAFSEGQAVHYRQGRGVFNAKVVRVDGATGAVTVERLADGKRVVRPATKVAPGEAEVSSRVRAPEPAPEPPKIVEAVKPIIRKRARPEMAAPQDLFAAPVVPLAPASAAAPAPMSAPSVTAPVPTAAIAPVAQTAPVSDGVPASRFAAGQKVRYKEGWDTFEAKVLEIDIEKGLLKLERVDDGKTVEMPVEQVFVAA